MDFFERDGVYDLIDGDVYTSEIPWTKPSPAGVPRRRWTRSASSDPARCVYVGDRLFDDIWGAQQAGMRAVHVPLSDIPAEQIGHTEGEPDGVIHRLADLPDLLIGLVTATFLHCINMREQASDSRRRCVA